MVKKTKTPRKAPRKDKRLQNLKEPWKPGESGNPIGRPKGRKNFSTLFEQAIKKIIREKKLPIKDPETEMVIKAIIKALKGNYPFFRDLMDRRYGKAPGTLDITSAGKPLPLLKNVRNDHSNTKDTEAQEEN